jgi:hypothetical protein
MRVNPRIRFSSVGTERGACFASPCQCWVRALGPARLDACYTLSIWYMRTRYVMASSSPIGQPGQPEPARPVAEDRGPPAAKPLSVKPSARGIASGRLANAPSKSARVEPAQRRGQRGETEAKRKTLRQLQSTFSPLCFSFAEKIERLRANGGGVEGQSYVPFDLRNALLMERTPALYDDAISPINVMPIPMGMNERRSFIDFVHKVRGSAPGEQKIAKLRAMTPAEVADRFYLTLANPEFLTNVVAVPVGEYGETFAFDIMRAATILKRAAKELVEEEAMQLKRRNPALVGRTQLDLMQSGEPGADRFNSPLATLQDGIDSIADAIVEALGRKNGGPDDPMEALRAVTGQRIVEALSLRLGFGVIAPTREKNALFENAVEWKDGVPALTAQFREQLRVQRDAMTDVFRQLERLPAFAPGVITGMGCPVGHPIDTGGAESGEAIAIAGGEPSAKASGVQILSETFLAVMEDLAARRVAGIVDEIPTPEIHIDNKPSRFSTIPRGIALDEVISHIDSFRHANDALRNAAELETAVCGLHYRGTADPSAETARRFKSALGGLEIAALETEVINAAHSCKMLQRRIEHLITEDAKWRKSHPDARASLSADERAHRQAQAKHRTQAEEALSNSRKRANILLWELPEKIEQIDSGA